jgi:membrane associated rhomboid family serine protease
MYNLTPVVRNLLIINVLVFFGGEIAKLDLNTMFALHNFKSPMFKLHQILTYMFLHGDTMHLIGNMFGLVTFGSLLERLWGSQRFLFFYLFTGIGAGLLFMTISHFEMNNIAKAIELYSQHPSIHSFNGFFEKYTGGTGVSIYNYLENQQINMASQQFLDESVTIVKNIYTGLLNVPTLGASGAIFGIIMAFGMLFPNTEMMLMFLPVPIKAKYFVTFYGLYELYAGIQRSPTDNVAHFAHLGGMLFAFILLKYWGNSRKNFY